MCYNFSMSQAVSSPTHLVLMGVTGDLVGRKILPALYSLHKKALFPENLNIIGYSRRDWDDEELRSYIAEKLGLKEEDEFLRYFIYAKGVFEDLESYKHVAEMMDKVDKRWQVCSNKLYYLAVPPRYYQTIFNNLHRSGLTSPCSREEGWSRVIVEKPFGSDLKTAQELDQQLAKLFKEEQIYRIDHYLGKEIMQNILVFRFSNNLLENSWDNSLIEKVEIKFYEQLGLEGRGEFYDGVGALRDVGQNHMLQMLSLVTMNDPLELTAENIRENRAAILRSLSTPSLEDIKQDTKRAQFEGYKDEEGTASDSQTETFFRVRAELKANKWFGVPITLEGGKGFAENVIETAITFKGKYHNKVIFNMDKRNMGIYMHMLSKKPGLDTEVEERVFSLPICSDPKECEFAPAYEKLLLDCFLGNQSLFVSTDEVEASWKFIDPIICAWQENEVPLENYSFGEKIGQI